VVSFDEGDTQKGEKKLTYVRRVKENWGVKKLSEA